MRLLFALLLCGCAARAAPPAADAPQRPFPDLAGRSVMLLPVQRAAPPVAAPAGARAVALPDAVRDALEAELAFWLAESVPRVRWQSPDAIERAVLRSPTLDVRVRDLSIQDFLRARLESIGDPLYGELRRVAVLMDARPALLPIGAVWVPDDGASGRIHLFAALIDTTGGAVMWQGVVAGEPGALDERATSASTAQALARLVSGRR